MAEEPNICNFYFFVFISVILNIITLTSNFSSVNYYIKSIKKVWVKYPILDLSLTKKKGYEKIIFLNSEQFQQKCDCSLIDDFKRVYEGECNQYKLSKGCVEFIPNNATFILGKELYAKYYKANYLTLNSRLLDDGKACKDGYKRCGYLDEYQNTFCVEEDENCPINSVHFELNDSNSIIDIKTDNTRKDLPIINNIFIFEDKEPTIFEIDSSIEYKDKESNLKIDKYRLLPLEHNKIIIKKKTFFEENKLIKGEFRNLFKEANLFLYTLNYPGRYTYLGIYGFYAFQYLIFIKIAFLIFQLMLLFEILPNKHICLFIIVYSFMFVLNSFFLLFKDGLLIEIFKNEYFFKYFLFSLIIDVISIIRMPNDYGKIMTKTKTN